MENEIGNVKVAGNITVKDVLKDTTTGKIVKEEIFEDTTTENKVFRQYVADMKKDYIVTSYEVTTADDYILKLFRIVKPDGDMS